MRERKEGREGEGEREKGRVRERTPLTFILSSSFIRCSFPLGTRINGGPLVSVTPLFCFEGAPWEGEREERGVTIAHSP